MKQEIFSTRDTPPPMSREEERAAFAALRAGDESQRDRIVLANMGWVYTTAKWFASARIDEEDLIQEGVIGMMRSMETFDPDLGIKFVSYARRGIFENIYLAANGTRIIRIPESRRRVCAMVREHRVWMEQQLLSSVQSQEAADALGVTWGEWDDCQINSLDAPAMDGEEGWSDFTDVGGKHFKSMVIPRPEIEEHIDQSRQVQTVVAAMVALCDARAQEMIRLYFWLNDTEDHPLTLEEIGDRHDLSKERVRQILKESLDKIRKRVGVRAIMEMEAR